MFVFEEVIFFISVCKTLITFFIKGTTPSNQSCEALIPTRVAPLRDQDHAKRHFRSSVWYNYTTNRLLSLYNKEDERITTIRKRGTKN